MSFPDNKPISCLPTAIQQYESCVCTELLSPYTSPPTLALCENKWTRDHGIIWHFGNFKNRRMLVCLQVSLRCEDMWSIASLKLFKDRLLPEDRIREPHLPGPSTMTQGFTMWLQGSAWQLSKQITLLSSTWRSEVKWSVLSILLEGGNYSLQKWQFHERQRNIVHMFQIKRG